MSDNQLPEKVDHSILKSQIFSGSKKLAFYLQATGAKRK
jgi:hypothetical protein